MCWNQYISLNTYIFGIFVLLLIAFNNKYSSYKLEEFKNPYTYLFLISIITMQLIEFFLWRNLNNEAINRLFSSLGALLLIAQPIASLSMLKNINLRNKLMIIYSIPSLIFIIYKLFTDNFNTTISKSGHLKWNWSKTGRLISILGYIYYLFFLYFSLFYNKYYAGIIFTLPLFFLTYYFYYKDGTSGSMWCWTSNIIMIFYLIKLLIYLPYKEKGFLC
jgi:hypothetical protein